MADPVVIIPGFLLTQGRFKAMRAALRALTGAPVHVVPVTVGDWVASIDSTGWTRILSKLERTVRGALEESGAEKAVLVGHSVGGIIGRLFLSPDPFRGHVYDGKKYVRGLITLGSPHQGRRGSPMRRRVRALCPGACFAPEVAYMSVAGKAVRGGSGGSARERISYRGYKSLCGRGGIWGDGTVPVDSAMLEGSRQLILDGVHHSCMGENRRWYGSADVVAEWWKAWLEREGSGPEPPI